MDIINQITYGDSFELIHQVPDKSIDLILTDPPYFLLAGKGLSNKSWDSSIELLPEEIKVQVETGNLTNREKKEILKEAIATYFKNLSKLLIPKVKNNGIIIIFNRKHNLEIIENVLMNDNSNEWYCTYMEWKKKNPQPQINELEQSEYALIAFNLKESSEKLNQLPEFWQDTLSTDNLYLASTPAIQKTIYYGKAKHVSPKPVELWHTLIRRFSNPDDLVMDIFSGTGLTALACFDLGRDFIAFEFEQEQFANSVERLHFFENNMPKSLFLFED